jgi:hypothetical protein
MEETQSGSLKDCSRPSSTFKQPFSNHKECLLTGGFKEREENSDKCLSCNEDFNDVNLPDLNCFVKM